MTTSKYDAPYVPNTHAPVDPHAKVCFVAWSYHFLPNLTKDGVMDVPAFGGIGVVDSYLRFETIAEMREKGPKTWNFSEQNYPAALLKVAHLDGNVTHAEVVGEVRSKGAEPCVFGRVQNVATWVDIIQRRRPELPRLEGVILPTVGRCGKPPTNAKPERRPEPRFIVEAGECVTRNDEAFYGEDAPYADERTTYNSLAAAADALKLCHALWVGAMDTEERKCILDAHGAESANHLLRCALTSAAAYVDGAPGYPQAHEDVHALFDLWDRGSTVESVTRALDEASQSLEAIMAQRDAYHGQLNLKVEVCNELQKKLSTTQELLDGAQARIDELLKEKRATESGAPFPPPPVDYSSVAWETVNNARTQRLRVPGGWLYRVRIKVGGLRRDDQFTVTFVPCPEE